MRLTQAGPDVQQRHEPEDEAGRDRDAEREREHDPVERDLGRSRNRVRVDGQAGSASPPTARPMPTTAAATDRTSPRSPAAGTAARATRRARCARCIRALRESARAISRFARFAHAISSTKPTAACSTTSDVFTDADDVVVQRIDPQRVIVAQRAAPRHVRVRVLLRPGGQPQFEVGARLRDASCPS